MADEMLSRGENTRSDILNAAHDLFLDYGYHGTSMRQIAQEANIALGSIYNHFSSKEDLFLNVLVEYHPFHYVLPLMQAAQGKSIEEFIRNASHRMVDGVGERIDFLNLMFIELVEFKGVHLPSIFDAFVPQVMRFAQNFLQDQDELRPIPSLVVVRAYIGLFFSYLITEVLIAKQLPPEMMEDALDYFVDIFLHGILVNQRTEVEKV
jgi:AcrR family transcriptional regulator